VDAYEWAWADGEPYVYRYNLGRAGALLHRLGADLPELPPYDPERDPKLPFEDELDAAVAELRAQRRDGS
jgi:hypothetical protein